MLFFSSKPKQPGFALLYAVVVVAVVSSLGTLLADLLVREASLTATAKESTQAFYAADAGVECAKYWDRNQDHFPRSGGSVGDITCAGQSGIDVTESGSSDPVYSFTIDSDNGGNSAAVCAEVSVEKTTVDGRQVTRIESLGKNTCESGVQVERAIRSSY